MHTKKLPIDLLLITDDVETGKIFSIHNRNSEGMTANSAADIFEKLKNLCKTVTWLQGYEELAKSPSKFKNHVIFPIYYGVAHRNSKSLIPAICEANELRYIGADSYTHMICNDKHTAKKIAEDFDIKTPRGLLIRKECDCVFALNSLKYPLVVKPNFGGGSNGIIKKNLCRTASQAKELIVDLLKFQAMPVLVEEYIEGEEIEVILFGNHRRTYVCQEVQIVNNGEKYFTDWIWGLEDKKIDDSRVELISADLLNFSAKRNCMRLFEALSKVEFMRIDCRVKQGEPYLVELSPDSYLGEDGGFSFAFSQLGYDHQKMLEVIILNSIDPSYRFIHCR